MAFLKFEDLRVFRAAEALADEIWDVVNDWETFAKLTVGKQLARSADSIGANIAEDSGRETAKDNQRFVRISRGSLNGAKYRLCRASPRNLIKPEEALKPTRMIEEIGPSLNAYLKFLNQSIRSLTAPMLNPKQD